MATVKDLNYMMERYKLGENHPVITVYNHLKDYMYDAYLIGEAVLSWVEERTFNGVYTFAFQSEGALNASIENLGAIGYTRIDEDEETYIYKLGEITLRLDRIGFFTRVDEMFEHITPSAHRLALNMHKEFFADELALFDIARKEINLEAFVGTGQEALETILEFTNRGYSLSKYSLAKLYEIMNLENQQRRGNTTNRAVRAYEYGYGAIGAAGGGGGGLLPTRIGGIDIAAIEPVRPRIGDTVRNPDGTITVHLADAVPLRPDAARWGTTEPRGNPFRTTYNNYAADYYGAYNEPEATPAVEANF